ncbi:MAG: 50S ribosomal protein L25/general stress protein Ctc [Bermanella sp.]
MSNFEINAELRELTGTSASRRLRREQGITPGIVYGAGKEPTQVTMQLKDLNKAFENEGFFSHIIKLNLDGKSEDVMIKDVQRHAFRPIVLHVDFLRVNKDTIIKQHIPLHFINEEECQGVKLQGGKITHVMSDVEVICAAGDLPEFIEVDMIDAEVGTIIHLSELKLSAGVKILALTHGEDHDASVVNVAIPKGVADDEEAADSAEGEEAPAAE